MNKKGAAAKSEEKASKTSLVFSRTFPHSIISTSGGLVMTGNIALKINPTIIIILLVTHLSWHNLCMY